MFIRVLLSGVSLAVLRFVLVFFSGGLFDDFHVFSASTFAPVLSAYFLISGHVASRVLSEYKDAEIALDDTVTAMHLYFDSLIMHDSKFGASFENVTNALSEFIRTWCDGLKLEVLKSGTVHARALGLMERAVLEIKRTSPVSTDFQKESMKCIAALRKSVQRIDSIRRTVALSAMQLFMHVLLLIVLASLMVTDFVPNTTTVVNKHAFVELLIVATSATCVLLLHKVVNQLDDPFCSPPSRIKRAVESILAATRLFIPDRNFRSLGANDKDISVSNNTKWSGAESDSDESPSVNANTPVSKFGKLLEKDLEEMQISVAPLLRVVRQRSRGLKKLQLEEEKKQ